MNDKELEEKIEKLHVDWLNTDGYKFYQFYNDIIQTVRKHMAHEVILKLYPESYVDDNGVLVIRFVDIKDLLLKYTGENNVK